MGNEFKLKYHENNFVRRKRSPWKNRVEQAEELIRILPNDAPGRNTWLFQFGISEEAQIIRANTNLL